jgi:acetyl-CoA synthetase
VRSGSFEKGDIAWFPEGALNVAYNCVDRWAFKHPDKVRHFFLGVMSGLSS